MDSWMDRLRERRGPLALVVLLGGSGLWWWSGRPVSHPPGVLAPEDPLQGPPDRLDPWSFHGHTLRALASFELRARVLSAERYRLDRAAELSPVDLALGWGPMSDSAVLEAISIRQADRWYFWQSGNLPIPAGEVTSHSANMHMIPATEAVARRLKAVREGQLVELKGQLVRVDGPGGWHWVSSLTRTDTGDGSCEVIWVESARVADR